MSLTDFLQFAASSGVGGVVVALANHFLTKRKTSAEIDKLNADTELTKAQARQITNSLNDLSDKVGYKLPDVAHSTETIIYTSADSDRFDFRLLNVDNAEGELTVRSGVLSISRANTAGTTQIWLEKYKYGEPAELRKLLPKNENISGTRKLRVSCEIKAVGGEHTILFIIKGEKAPLGEHMATKRERITQGEWMPIEAYFQVSPGQNCFFRIDDRSVSKPGSSVQIRNLVLAEKKS